MTKSRPNVLIFMTDQQRADTISGDSVHRAITPRLDDFRETATTYTRAYAPAPHCCPSRTSFFSGVYPSEHGVWNNVNVTNSLSRGPRPGTPFWSEEFLSAGYELAISGKWHISDSMPPSQLGWKELFPERFVRGTSGSAEEATAAARARELAVLREAPPSPESGARRPGEILRPGYPAYELFGVEEDPFRDAQIVQAGIDYLREPKEKPWVLYVGTLGPHDPYVPPQRFIDMYDFDAIELPASFDDTMHDKPNLYRRTRQRFDQMTRDEHREALRRYLAFCSYEDYLFGRALDALTESGLAEETVVLYTSDHGDYAAEHGLWTKGLPAFQGAYHVPFALRVPAGTVSAEVADSVSLCDVGPTLLDACGIAQTARRSGVSALDRSHEARDVFYQTNGNEIYGMQRTIVSGRFKLVVNLFDFDELYDLEADPQEMTNLLHVGLPPRETGTGPVSEVPDEYRDVVRGLYQRLWRFAVEHEDEILNEYILTALSSYGPMDVLEPNSQ